MTDIFEKHGITKKEVLEWGTRIYPQFTNENILAQLYLKQVKKLTLDPREVELMTGKEVDVEDLTTGDWCIIDIIVGTKIRENSYLGCPNCSKKVAEDKICRSCGPVIPVTLFWTSYVAGDNTGDVMLSVPPRISNDYRDLEGIMMKARGVLGDQGEFMVQNMEMLKEPPKELEEKKAEDTGDMEVAALKNVLTNFPVATYEDLKTWHRQRNLTTDLDMLIIQVGAEKDEEGNVALKV